MEFTNVHQRYLNRLLEKRGWVQDAVVDTKSVNQLDAIRVVSTGISSSEHENRPYACLVYTSFGVEQVRLIEQVESECKVKKQYFIICLGKSPTSSARNNLKENTIHFEFYSANDLLYDPLNHITQPHYTKLNDRLKHIRGLNPQNLPIMRKDDPVRRYYGWKSRSIIQCVSPLSVTYRYVE